MKIFVLQVALFIYHISKAVPTGLAQELPET